MSDRMRQEKLMGAFEKLGAPWRQSFLPWERESERQTRLVDR